MSLYITYIIALLSSLLCDIVKIKIPYLLLTFLTVCTFIVLVATAYLGFAHFQSKSSLVFIALYGTVNTYIWTLAYYFAPLQEEEEDLGADVEMISRSDSDSSEAPFLAGAAHLSDRPATSSASSARSGSLRKSYEVSQFSLPVVYT